MGLSFDRGRPCKILATRDALQVLDRRRRLSERAAAEAQQIWDEWQEASERMYAALDARALAWADLAAALEAPAPEEELVECAAALLILEVSLGSLDVRRDKGGR